MKKAAVGKQLDKICDDALDVYDRTGLTASEALGRTLSARDAHAAAAFWAMHHGALALKKPSPRPKNIERLIMSMFGLIEKNGPYRLTRRGKRVLAFAKTNPK